MAEKQKKVTHIKDKETKKAYAKKVKLAEKTRKRKEKSKKRKDKKWKKILSKQQDTGTKVSRWIRKHDMEGKKELYGGKLDRGGLTYEKEEQKKVKVIKKPKEKRQHAREMRKKKIKEINKRGEASRKYYKEKQELKAKYYHKTGKKPLLIDLPGVPSKAEEKVGKFPSIPGSDKKRQKELTKKWRAKQKKKAAEYEQPIVKYKAKGGPVKVVSKKKKRRNCKKKTS